MLYIKQNLSDLSINIEANMDIYVFHLHLVVQAFIKCFLQFVEPNQIHLNSESHTAPKQSSKWDKIIISSLYSKLMKSTELHVLFTVKKIKRKVFSNHLNSDYQNVYPCMSAVCESDTELFILGMVHSIKGGLTSQHRALKCC